MNDALDDMIDDHRDPHPRDTLAGVAIDLCFWFIVATFWSAALVFSLLFWIWLASRIAAMIRS